MQQSIWDLFINLAVSFLGGLAGGSLAFSWYSKKLVINQKAKGDNATNINVGNNKVL